MSKTLKAILTVIKIFIKIFINFNISRSLLWIIIFTIVLRYGPIISFKKIKMVLVLCKLEIKKIPITLKF